MRRERQREGARPPGRTHPEGHGQPLPACGAWSRIGPPAQPPQRRRARAVLEEAEEAGTLRGGRAGDVGDAPSAELGQGRRANLSLCAKRSARAEATPQDGERPATL
jgi:hypothetical protein